MEPVLLEFISRDNTKEGMQSVIGNMSVVEKSIQDNTVMIRQLEKVLKEMQTQFAGTTQTISDQTDNIAMMEALKKEIDELKAKLLELEEIKRRGADAPIVHPSVPRAAASQFNGLGMSIQQVARELPSLTMGANMFFLAISNNLPILADNLRVAKAEVKALNDAGQKSTPVWKQVTSSIFSWQTALVVGITLLTVYGKDVVEWTKGLFKSKQAIDMNRASIDSLSQARLKGAQSAQTELSRLKLLYQATQNDALGKKEQLKAVKELQDKYPSYFGNLSSEEILAGNAAKAYKNLAAAIIESAKARAYEDKIVENEKKLLELRGDLVHEMLILEQTKKYKVDANAAQGGVKGGVVISEEWDEQNKKVQDIIKQRKALVAANKSLAKDIKPTDLLFGDNKPKEPKNETENLIDKISDSELKARQKVEEMKVAIMEKGAAKEKAAARARFDAELLRIDQEERERLEALAKAKKQGLPVSKEQVDAVTSQASQQRKGASEVYVKEFVDIEKEYADKQKKDFDSLVGKYQDYTAQRLSIEKKFNEDIAKIQKERDKAQQKGDAAKVEQTNRAIAQATANKGKELIKLDFDQLKETPEYVRAFENLKETSSDTLSSLLSQLENAKSAAAQVLSPDQLREYTTTIQEIMDELDARNPFQTLADRKAELAEAEQELAKAQQQLNAVQNGAQIVTGVKKSKFNKDTGKIESEKSYLTATKAAQNYSKAQDKVAKSSAKVKKAEKEVNDEMNELFYSIKDVGDAIGGQSGQIINLIGDISGFTMSVMNGIEAVADTSATAISNVEKASVILAIISAAVQVATKIAKLFKGESDEEKRKKELEHYNKIIAIYDKIIDKQKEGIKFGYGFSAIDSASKAMVELNKQTDVYRKIANSNAVNLMLKPKNLAAYKKALADLGIQADLGDLFKTDELSNLSSKQLEYIRDNYKDLWASLRDEQRDALQAIIDAEEKGKDVIDKWQEAITGISYDSFYDGFIENLANMDMSAADMANNFGEYLRKSILGAMVAKNFQKEIGSLYQLWVSAADDQSAGGIDITKIESDEIQKKYKELIEAMTAARDNMAKDFGWESTTSQSGKAGAFTTVTQDQGTKIEGLFTSVQGHVSTIDDTVKDISMIMGKAIDALSKIVENTDYCKYLEQMAADISELKRDGFKMK